MNRKHTAPAPDPARASRPSLAATLQAALQAHQRGDLPQAERLYRQVLQQQPRHADALHLLGLLAHQAGNTPQALTLLRQAIACNGRVASYHNNLGSVLTALGQLDEAAACYRQALRLDPACPEAHYNLGNLLYRQGRFAAACEHYRAALRLRPDYAEAHSNLGLALKELGDLPAARYHGQAAVRLQPGCAEMHYNLGTVCQQQGDLEAATRAYQTAVRLQPGNARAHNNLGTLFYQQYRLEEALRCFQTALRLDPHDAETLANLGLVLQARGDWEGALVYYEQALRLQPDFAEARFSRGLLLLAQGRLAEGWQGYEWRYRRPGHALRPFPFVPWQGERFERGTLVVSAEQGLGDELLFASCLPDALEQVGHLVLECDPRLAPLLARSLPRVTVVGQARSHTGWTKRLPAGTRHSPAGSLPRWLRPTLEAFFPQRLRLRAAPNQIRRWRSWLAGLGSGLKVGVLWRSLRQRAHQGHYAPVGQWQRLWALEGIWWVSLQYDGGKEELEALGETRVVVPELDVWGDLEGVAGLLAGLDLVVGPETALVQLGGALGRRVWCVVAYPGSWPQLGTGGMPWWEGVRYWVAPGPGRWEELFSAMAQELTLLAQQATGSATAPGGVQSG
ncbi:MAG: hypothetical protein KatS3mg131_1311 [Candidatus Tectimicrobiota bacterium]|nr:MAG: hypothetical protein KatS3mg131_1311 [Candidatus Tectomicrobia bacterium]